MPTARPDAPADAVNWRRGCIVLFPAVAIVLGSFAAIRWLGDPVISARLDNVHWTTAYLAAAVLAWSGVRTAPARAMAARRCFAWGLTLSAIGQLIWDVQTAIDWNPFPAPSTVFYIWLGPACALGMWSTVRAHAAKMQLRTIALDAAALVVALLALTLALYLPKRGDLEALPLNVLVAYPVGLFSAAAIGVVAVLSLRLKPGWRVALMPLALVGCALVWLQWNSQSMHDYPPDGSWLNLGFSAIMLLMGLGAMTWQPEVSVDARWERFCEGALRLLPLLLVVIAAASVVLVWVLPGVPGGAQIPIASGAVVVLVLSVARQSMLLTERDRLLQAEQRTRESEGRFRSLFETAQDGIFLMNDREFIDCNASVLRMFRCTREQIVGRSPVDFSPAVQPDRQPTLAKAREKIAAALGGTPQVFEWQHSRLDGSRFDAEVSLNRIELGGRNLLQAIVRDVTEQRRLEGQLRQSQKMEAVGQLSGGIAHDFNNILTVIKGQVGLLQGSPEVTPVVADALAEIDSAASRAAKLTRQLLAFSRRQVFSVSPLDLNEVVANLTKMLRRVLGEHVSMQLDYAPEVLGFAADAGMIEQVLVNLAVNARDAMPDGGILRITTRAETRRPSAARGDGSGMASSAWVRLTVADTGTGIPPEIRSRIFEPFFTTKDVGKGTGLGLATVFGIVQQHQGWIELESEVGRGTTFHIFLPRLATLPGEIKPLPPAPPPRGRNELVLVVEDEPTVQRVAMSALERHGYRVLTAANGQEALAVWRERAGEIDLMLTDMIMPGGISGLQLARQIQAERPDLRVIYSSGYSKEIAGRELTAAEAGNYLAKPYDLDRLFRLVRAILDNPPGRGPAASPEDVAHR